MHVTSVVATLANGDLFGWINKLDRPMVDHKTMMQFMRSVLQVRANHFSHTNCFLKDTSNLCVATRLHAYMSMRQGVREVISEGW